MIYLTPGVTSSNWFSTKESVEPGMPTYRFTMTNDISGATISFLPVDTQSTNKWSCFFFYVGVYGGTATPNPAINYIDARPGMWSYVIEDRGKLLETGKMLIEETKTWTTLERPAKNVKVLKR